MTIAARAHGDGGIAIVVSALGHSTDMLHQAAQYAAQCNPRYQEICRVLGKVHLESARELALDTEIEMLTGLIETRINELQELLRGISLVGECSRRSLDGVLSFGEGLSSAIAAAALRQQGIPAEACDTRGLIVTDRSFGNARVDVEATYHNLRAHFESTDVLQVVPGFVGSTPDMETTTLGRGGSDLTAAHLGAALNVEAIELWTDVNGVMSADPRVVPRAFSLLHLRYEELMELAHFGARVVYPPSVHPARSKNIPLVIKNTLNPDFEGTWVGKGGPADSNSVRGLASLSDVSLLRLEGDGMAGVPGFAMRLFSALARRNVNVILIGQASSEHSICFAVLPDAVPSASEEITREFLLERQAGLIDDLVVEQGLSVIAVVGNRMREHPGIAGQLFSVLGDRGVNIRAIAQGSSELNISLVIKQTDESLALNIIHDSFFGLSGRTSHLFVMGAGRVGTALMRQLEAGAEHVRESHEAHLMLCGVSNSRYMLQNRDGLTLEQWNDVGKGATSGQAPADLQAWIQYIIETPGHRVVIDCTALGTLAPEYIRLKSAGVDVVSANKLPFAGTYADYAPLVRRESPGSGRVYMETTVGAALPILHTLNGLVQTGDRIVRIEGLLSGTIGFLMHKVRSGTRFSEALREALERGYTEPDPREDLTGNDVARKILILARAVGLTLEPEDVVVEKLVPDHILQTNSLDDFWDKLESVDADFYAKVAAATAQSKVLSYVATLADGKAQVDLQALQPDHPCARVGGTGSLVAFYSERYEDAPLVVRGAGAGPEITASGVFADVLQAVAERK
jgi:aspartokinase/homoserine dehydrogenase 1